MEKDKNSKDDILIIGKDKYFPSQFKGEGIVKKETEINIAELFKGGNFFSKCERRCLSVKEVREVLEGNGWIIYCKK